LAGLHQLELRGAWHPCIAANQRSVSSSTSSSAIGSGNGYIPNDIVLGCEDNPARFVLVTGPNMGGKSTTLRLSCVAVILAQVGCYVPAEKCILTPVVFRFSSSFE
jgi:DNA mismatch repair protein MSH6